MWAPKYQCGREKLDQLGAHMAPGVLKLFATLRRFSNFIKIFPLFHYYLPLEKARPSILTTLNPHHSRMFCAKFGLKFWRRILLNIFHYFALISPWKLVGTFIWRNLNPHLSRMLCAKCNWNTVGPVVLEKILSFINV